MTTVRALLYAVLEGNSETIAEEATFSDADPQKVATQLVSWLRSIASDIEDEAGLKEVDE